jgi:ferredoxin
MGSIPKIVLTPLKWASKKVIHHTLLRFPGGDTHSPIACVYCPEMCRFSCPTAVVSGNDAVTPCNKMGLLYKEETWPGQTAPGQPLWPIYDCTGCGRCTEYCVYDMPVASKLFEARKQYSWDVAKSLAAEISDQDDPVGDLADELGDGESSNRRLMEFLSRGVNGAKEAKEIQVNEPKSAYFLKQHGHVAQLSLETILERALSPAAIKQLSNRTWLLHESVWYSRHLDGAKKLLDWVVKARELGIEIRRSFAQGRDCIDCGGEGAYSRLFPKQAFQMAKEIWERDQHRADGILCFSKRCAVHFQKSLSEMEITNQKVLVLSFQDLLGQDLLGQEDR